jgi:very-short-patch-repair endonuclease
MPVNLTPFAKAMRKDATEAEQRLWLHLKGRRMEGLKFRRQEQIGRFIVDFVCYEKVLIVEADGGQHAAEEDKEKDRERTAWLNGQGFAVLRFWNNEVLTNTDGVLETIRQRCAERPSPQPSPTEGRGSKPLQN